MGSREFINNLDRYILDLQGANPTELKKCPMVISRVNAVREVRLNSPAKAIQKKAATPTLFGQITNTESDYIIIPRVSSERRNYVPIGFISKDVISSDAVQIIPGANIYHFGILTSNIHNAWMRAVAGRLGSSYRYSKDIVYNNSIFPALKYS